MCWKINSWMSRLLPPKVMSSIYVPCNTYSQVLSSDFTHASYPLRFIRHQFRPFALFLSARKKPGSSVAHASQSFGIGCLVHSVAASLTASQAAGASCSRLESWPSVNPLALPAPSICLITHQKNHGEITLHSSLLKFPKFTRSPLSIPVLFR